MAAKPRVHEIASELGVDSKIALAKLKELGEFVKSPSSTIEPPVARKLRAALEADGARPVAGPVHQDPVGESHPPEPNLVPAHSPSVRATCMRKRVPSSRSSTGMRSSAEWISAAATSDSIARIGKNP